MSRCLYCLGEHEPDTSDTYVDWQGKRYFMPFHCLCCGKEICACQFAWGRCCAVCDMGLCQTNPVYYHPPRLAEMPKGVQAT